MSDQFQSLTVKATELAGAAAISMSLVKGDI